MPATMKAVQIKNDKGDASALYIGEVERPTLEAGQVLVKVKAFGLNRMDILQREGKYPVPPQAGPILGVEFSGVVVEVDDESKEIAGETISAARWSVGDEVFGLTYGGAYAQFVAVSGAMLIRKPARLSWIEAAGIPENFLTAYQALVLVGEYSKGESVLVHAGASGVGVAANQIARASGAKHVLTTAGSDDKVRFLERLEIAPTKGINYRTEDFAEVVQKQTDGKGVDVVIDFVGADYFKRNIDVLAPSGRLVFLAALSGATVESVDLSKILYKRLSLKGTTLRARDEPYQKRLLDAFEKEVLPLMKGEGNGGIQVMIHDVIPWERVHDAHEMMESNKNSGKIVLTIPDDA